MRNKRVLQLTYLLSLLQIPPSRSTLGILQQPLHALDRVLLEFLAQF